MASLSRLLNDTAEGAPAAGPSTLVTPSPATATARPKSKRPSRAVAAWLADDDIDGNARRSSRQSTKPKRYAEELYDEDGQKLQTDYDTAFSMPGRMANGRFMPKGVDGKTGVDGNISDSAVSDEEGDGLLRATSHIWREPLQSYILAMHAKRQTVERDFEKAEQSRQFVTAARVTEMSAKRIVDMRERKEARLVEIKLEEEAHQRVMEEDRIRLEKEEAKKLAKDKDKEERLRKQREAAKKKRDEDRAKKEREDESRRARSEKERMAKLAEQQRKAALTPEEREAEEKSIALEKEIAVAKALTEVDAVPEGRGGRKKRKKDPAEDDPSKSSGPGRHGDGAFPAGGPDGELDELEDDDTLAPSASSSTHAGAVEVASAVPSRARKSKGSTSRRTSAPAYDYQPYPQPGFYPPPPGAVDHHGRPIHNYPYQGYPPPMPSGAYLGPDGVVYDAHGQPIAYPGPPPGYMVPGPRGNPGNGSPSSSSSAGHYPPSHPTDPHQQHHHAHYHASGPPGHGYAPEGIEPGFGYGDAGEDVEEMLAMTGKGSRNPKVLATKRWKAVEDLEKRVWSQIAKRDIPKVIRVTQQSTSSRQFFAKRLSTIVAREARRAAQRTRGAKDIQTRAKKVMREMMVFMKGNEKRDRETRKKAEKEALDKAKKEEDMREAQRAARKLNFLITQTELYSHFVGNKIKTSEAEDSPDTAGAAPAPVVQQSASLLAAIAAGDAPAGAELKELDFDIDDETNAAYHARRNAQAAVDAAKQAAAAFDAAAGGAPVDASGAPTVSTSSAVPAEAPEEMDFQNPTAMNGDVQVKQPKLLTCTLKEYQLKGLNWLANLYEQGINGILADEMGLGKTVQSISLMAYLAEVHNIWGPFLVIAPASTLHNWQQEISRFVPSLKALPYWGNTKDRAILRKFWNRKSLRYDKDAPFHILVTSYQLVVQDEKYFQGVKWQYMVLDEAQAIKSSTSARWKTLLGFRCRNRLLLTGTPIQNSMHELWALLHFIMPSLFDSHDEFSEWFSKDIEGNAEKQGAMNEHQLRRLHMILKPFMLRRIKKNVQNELGDKIEIDLYCDLTPRQKTMYRTLRENISITDLVSRATSINDDDSVKRLMNLIMQFRKVCNHPELFERADVTAPLAFASYNDTANLIRDPEVLEVPYAVSSVIEYRVPKLLYREGGMVTVVNAESRAGFDSLYLQRLMNIWTPDYIQQSLNSEDSTFSFARGLKLSPSELSRSVKAHGIIRVGLGMERQEASRDRDAYSLLSDEETSISPLRLDIHSKSAALPFDQSWRDLGLIPLGEVEQNFRLTSRLGRPDARFFIDSVVAPAIEAVCSDRSFAYDQTKERFDPLFSAAIYGVPLPSQNSLTEIDRFEAALPGFPAEGVLAASSPVQLPFPPMQVPQLQKLILDSGKLAKLDALLAELKANDHRVLLYFQMTRMIDLMEEYLAFRQYKYLRLDGSSTISERRDMVTDWQTKPEIFIFLLSTRAGGLGINLTAADTVIFYDSDWNPSNDLQAMDRAHRLGQTKQVTVYRLITKDTVDERIVQLARNKKLVQDAVVGSSSATPADGASAQKNEVMSLLLGEDELEESLRQAELKRKKAEEKAIADGRRGAKTREENKKLKLIEAAEKAAEKKKKLAGASWEAADDEDAFSFFTNPTNNSAVADDDDPTLGDGTGADTPKPARKKPGPKPGWNKKRKLDENGEEVEVAPKAPKRPKKKKEPAGAGPV